MTQRRSSQAGFLLADMLVTLTISAFVLAGLTGLGAVLLRTADRSVAQIQATDDLGRTMASLAHLLQTTARVRFSGTEPQPFLFNGDAQRLMFARARRDVGAFEVLAFRSEDAGALWRAASPLPVTASGPGDLSFGPAHVSYRGAAHLRFAYLGARDAGGSPAWASLWPIGMRMPQAVAVEALDAAGNRVLARMEVPLVADTDLGCLTGGFCGRSLDVPPAPAGAAAVATPAPAPAGLASSAGAGR